MRRGGGVIEPAGRDWVGTILTSGKNTLNDFAPQLGQTSKAVCRDGVDRRSVHGCPLVYLSLKPIHEIGSFRKFVALANIQVSPRRQH